MDAVIRLSEIRVNARIGVGEEERSEYQELLVDAGLKTDIRNAVIYDDIGEALDYMKVEETIRAVSGAREYSLVENLAYEICRALLTDFIILSVEIRITKFPAGLKGKAAGVSVEVGPLETAHL